MISAPFTDDLAEKDAAGFEEVLGNWKTSAIAADVATLGMGTLVAGLFNVAMVFLVPKLISVEHYGYWRLFALYAGYVGFLHFGFVDGALLRWAGRSFDQFRSEIPSFTRYLFLQHVVMLVPLGVLLSYFFPAQLRFIAGAVALYAMLYNLTALLQFSLQAARIFRPVAISFVLAPALSCACVFLWQFILPSSYLEVISIYVFASCVPLLFLLRWTQSWKRRSAQAMKGVAWSCIVSGFPITLVNTGAYLIQCADRLAISWTASIQQGFLFTPCEFGGRRAPEDLSFDLTVTAAHMGDAAAFLFRFACCRRQVFAEICAQSGICTSVVTSDTVSCSNSDLAIELCVSARHAETAFC
jgi:hypothetical protein